MRKFIVLSIIVLVSVGLTKDAGGGGSKKGELAKGMLKKLQGQWNMVKAEVDGRSIGGADSFGILFDDDIYHFLVNGQKQPNSAKVFLDPTKDPTTIDLVLKGVGVAGVHLGIIRFTEGGMEICMNQPRGAGSDKRPSAFTTKAAVGAGSVLYVLERPEGKVPEIVGKKDAKGSGDTKVSKKDAIKADLTKLLGNWKVVKMDVEGRPFSVGADRELLFDGDTYYNVLNGKKHPNSAKVFLDPTSEPKSIDLVLKGVGTSGTQLGIYRFTEDGLEICLNQARGANSTKRPKAFSSGAAVGAGSILYVLERAAK